MLLDKSLKWHRFSGEKKKNHLLKLHSKVYLSQCARLRVWEEHAPYVCERIIQCQQLLGEGGTDCLMYRCFMCCHGDQSFAEFFVSSTSSGYPAKALSLSLSAAFHLCAYGLLSLHRSRGSGPIRRPGPLTAFEVRSFASRSAGFMRKGAFEMRRHGGRGIPLTHVYHL